MPAFAKSWCCVRGRQLRRPDKTSREVDLKRTKIVVSCNPFKGIICDDISEIAVGTLITERPPHRTVRAQFGHTAPTSGV
jgi:hypothetical protein